MGTTLTLIAAAAVAVLWIALAVRDRPLLSGAAYQVAAALALVGLTSGS